MVRQLSLTMTLVVRVLVSAVLVGGTVDVVVAEGRKLPASSEPLPRLTFDDALAYRPTVVQDAHWFGDQTIVGGLRVDSTGESDIVAWDLRAHTRRRIGHGQYPSGSPDREYLVFLSGKVWKLQNDHRSANIDTGRSEATVVFKRPRWSRNGRYVAIAESVSRSDRAEVTVHRPSAAKTNVRGSSSISVVDIGAAAEKRSPNYFNYTTRITIVDVTKPGAPLRIELDDSAYYVGWGADDALYYVTLNYSSRPYTALWSFDLRTRNTKELWRLQGGIMQSAEPLVSPDSSKVALVLDLDTRKWEDFNSLAVMDLASGALTRVTTDHYVEQAVWSRDGTALYFLARQGGHFQIFRTDLKGSVVQVSSGDRRHFDLDLSPDGRFLSYQTEDGYGGRDLRVLDLTDGATGEHVVETLSSSTRRFDLGRFEQIRYPTSDGLSIFGYLVYPPDFDASRKYPLYVDVHGGGPGSYMYMSGPLTMMRGALGNPLEWHAWAALGYVVFVPDYRSSGEYGPRVGRDRYVQNDYAGVMRDAEDVQDGVRWLLSKGFIDDRRVAIAGHSAGGGRVNYLLTRSHLFAAAILNDPLGTDPITTLLDLTTRENAGVRFEDFNWSLIEATDGVRFADNPSAFLSGFLFDGYRNTTPTLILIGNPDLGALPPTSMEVLFSMLRQYDVPCRMLKYTKDGHVPNTAEGARHRFKEIRTWLERYIPEE